MRRWLPSLLLLLALSATAHGQDFRNFTAANQAARPYLQDAEDAREDIARFWVGKELPNWWKPCPVTVTKTTGPPGGATSFVIDGGHVYGWSMRLQGEDQRLRDSALPHEVDHAVRHSITRRTMARWLDEGTASLFEHPTIHADLRRQARQYAYHPCSAWRRFDDGKYPTAGRQGCNIMALYATGFSTVEWLLTTYGKDRLLEFMKDPRPPSRKFPSMYGMSMREGESLWRSWVAKRPPDCKACGCYMHGHTVTVAHQVYQRGKPTLWAVTAPWCFACKPFCWDWSLDARFRADLCRKFNVVPVNLDNYRQWARDMGIQSIPAFVTDVDGQVIHGYHGKAWLVAKLDGILAAAQARQPQVQPRPNDPIVTNPKDPNADWQPVKPRPKDSEPVSPKPRPKDPEPVKPRPKDPEPVSPFTPADPNAPIETNPKPEQPQDPPREPIVTNPPAAPTDDGGKSAPPNAPTRPAPSQPSSPQVSDPPDDGNGGSWFGGLLGLGLAVAAGAAGVGLPAWAVWSIRAARVVHRLRHRNDTAQQSPQDQTAATGPQTAPQPPPAPAPQPPPPPSATPDAPSQLVPPVTPPEDFSDDTARYPGHPQQEARRTEHTVNVKTPRPSKETVVEHQFVPVPVDDYRRAREQAVSALGRRYPIWVDVFETETSLIDQFLAADPDQGKAANL